MFTVPLTSDTTDDGESLTSRLLAHLGDTLHERHQHRSAGLDVPEPLASHTAIGKPPHARTSTVGSSLTFRHDGPFAMLQLCLDDDLGPAYRLSAFAGWENSGTPEDMREFYIALDKLLEQADALHDAYHVSCRCGATETIEAGYTAITDSFTDHYDTDHSERRISNMTVARQQVCPVTQPQPITKSTPVEETDNKQEVQIDDN